MLSPGRNVFRSSSTNRLASRANESRVALEDELSPKAAVFSAAFSAAFSNASTISPAKPRAPATMVATVGTTGSRSPSSLPNLARKRLPKTVMAIDTSLSLVAPSLASSHLAAPSPPSALLSPIDSEPDPVTPLSSLEAPPPPTPPTPKASMWNPRHLSKSAASKLSQKAHKAYKAEHQSPRSLSQDRQPSPSIRDHGFSTSQSPLSTFDPLTLSLSTLPILPQFDFSDQRRSLYTLVEAHQPRPRSPSSAPHNQSKHLLIQEASLQLGGGIADTKLAVQTSSAPFYSQPSSPSTFHSRSQPNGHPISFSSTQPPSLSLKRANTNATCFTSTTASAATSSFTDPIQYPVQRGQIPLSDQRFELSRRHAGAPTSPTPAITRFQAVLPISSLSSPVPSDEFASSLSPTLASATLVLLEQQWPTEAGGASTTVLDLSLNLPSPSAASSISSSDVAKRTSLVAKSSSRKQLRKQKHRRSGTGFTFRRNKSPLNMSDIFSSFKRIEVVEVLSPDRIREMSEVRRINEAQVMERQKTLEATMWMHAHPDDSPVAFLASTFASDQLKPRIHSMGQATVDADATATVTDVTDPDNQTMSILIYAPSLRDCPLKPLPSLPQIRIGLPDGRSDLLRRRRTRRTSRRAVMGGHDETGPPYFQPTETDKFLLLRSNPCTITMPSFRHGPIRFAKAELELSRVVDDTLDWTAYQMAILGGAGDWEDHVDDDEDLAVDMTAWFDSFGFPSAGGLVHERPAWGRKFQPRSPTTTASYSPISSASLRSANLNCEGRYSEHSDSYIPICLAGDHPGSGWKGSTVDLPGPASAAPRFCSPSISVKQWNLASPEAQYISIADRRDSYDSLPQSPMMTLVATHSGPHADQFEIVPMGYNLGHDLGDFLKWESEHVYAADGYDRD